MKMKIAFFLDILRFKRQSFASYSYADHNEKVLNNQSFIIYLNHKKNNTLIRDMFESRFTCFACDKFTEVEAITTREGANVMYYLQAGHDWLRYTINIPTLYHGYLVSPISFMGRKCAVVNDDGRNPVVPHIVEVYDTTNDLRDLLKIPNDAIVFGRYGANDTFDVDYVKDVIAELADKFYFIFMNTDEFINHPHVIFIEGMTDNQFKRTFINTCNAMLHARDEDEMFSISIAEFALVGKPIITNQQIEGTIQYNNKEQLNLVLRTFSPYEKKMFQDHTPEIVMKRFQEVLLC